MGTRAEGQPLVVCIAGEHLGRHLGGLWLQIKDEMVKGKIWGDKLGLPAREPLGCCRPAVSPTSYLQGVQMNHLHYVSSVHPAAASQPEKWRCSLAWVSRLGSVTMQHPETELSLPLVINQENGDQCLRSAGPAVKTEAHQVRWGPDSMGAFITQLDWSVLGDASWQRNN